MRQKHVVYYGILDDFGEVSKWQRDRPSQSYKYVIKRVAVKNPLEGVEEALI